MSKSKDEAIRVDNNMEIWDQVSRTDPDYTKTVEFGRKFTAIDAHSQIMAATQMFGPIGEGWGYNTIYGFQDVAKGLIVWCDLTFWWGNTGKEWEGNKGPKHINSFGPIRGCARVQTGDKTADTDAPKKACTDALTKSLSQLGFNADVFLGQFDDNKYVTELKKDKAANVEKEAEEYSAKRNNFITAVEGCLTGTEVDKVMENYKAWLGTLAPGTLAELKKWVAKKELELANATK